MNSSKSYQLSVDYSELEKRVLALFSQPIESTLSLPRADCKSTLRSMWSQHYYGMDIVEPIQDLGQLCARIISNDNSLRGTRADLVITDELKESIQEQMKMQETAYDGMVSGDCVENEQYVHVVGREGMYSRYDCTWSDYHDAYVYDGDIEHCAVEGVVHDQEELVYAQDRQVLIEHAEEHPVHGLILTEHAADCLGEKYLGNDDAEEAEEAA